MKKLKRYIKKFVRSEVGAELVEYAIVVAIVALLAVGILSLAETAENKISEANDLIADIDPSGSLGSGGGGNSFSGSDSLGGSGELGLDLGI